MDKIDLAWEGLIDSIQCSINIDNINALEENAFYKIYGKQFSCLGDGSLGFEKPNYISVKDMPLTYMAVLRAAIASRFCQNGKKFIICEDINEDASSTKALPTEKELIRIDEILDFISNGIKNTNKPDENDTFMTVFLRNRTELSYLRTIWLCLFYFSFQALRTPAEYLVMKCKIIYMKIFCQTKEVISRYLGKGQIETDKNSELIIDSDWLLLWLINNILGSERLSKFYKLNENIKPISSAVNASPSEYESKSQGGARPGYDEEPQIGATSTDIAKLFVHLSHLTLYALHLIKEEENKTLIKYENDKKVDKTNPSMGQQTLLNVNNNQYEHFAFGDIPANLGISRIDSQLHILTKYAYHHWNVHRELKIYERLYDQLRYELPLYAANQFYRDHIYHVMDVCLLGELLLTSKVKKRTFFWHCFKFSKHSNDSQIMSNLQHSDDPELLIRNWYVAALFHDFGYVIENIVNLINPVDDFKNKGFAKFVDSINDGIGEAKKILAEEINTYCKEFANKCNDDGLKKKISDKDSTDHGRAAWLHLMHWLDEVNPKDNYNSALHAIMHHNQKGPNVDIEKYPLTFLLFLCDHLQEWGRPFVGPGALSQAIVESLRYFEKVELNKIVKVWQLKICGLKLEILSNNKNNTLHDKSAEMSCTLNHNGLKFVLSYEEDILADFEPISTWLHFTDELQGLHCPKTKYLIPITIDLKNKKPGSSAIWYPTEMDLFQEFCEEEESAAYLLEWIQKARECKGKIKYRHNPATNGNGFTEVLSLDLPMDSRPLDRGINRALLVQFKVWKKRRLERNILQSGIGP